MAIFLGTRGGDIVASMSASRLLADVREKLAGKMAYLLPGEDETLLRRLQGRLEHELDFEEDYAGRFNSQMMALGQVQYADQLAATCDGFNALAREHFKRRTSVIAFQGLCTSFHDLLIGKALALAAGGAGVAGDGATSCCIVATGSAGRAEFLPGLDSRYFFIYSDGLSNRTGLFDEMRYQLIALLDSCGFYDASYRFVDDAGLWTGSETDWRKWVTKQMPGMDKLREVLAVLGDVRGIAGDDALSKRVTTCARDMLVKEQEKDLFTQAVKKLSSMPIALGIFGNFKILRSGEHRGSFNLDEAALNPLVTNIRILAVHHGIDETNTIDRIKGLLYDGHLGVDLADRLLKAYHLFAGYRIHKSIESGDHKLKEIYLNPDELGEEEAYLYKSALETVLNLEKIVYQVFSEQG